MLFKYWRGHNCQKWISRFLTCPYHNITIYRIQAFGPSTSNLTFITVIFNFTSMKNLGHLEKNWLLISTEIIFHLAYIFLFKICGVFFTVKLQFFLQWVIFNWLISILKITFKCMPSFQKNKHTCIPHCINPNHFADFNTQSKWCTDTRLWIT